MFGILFALTLLSAMFIIYHRLYEISWGQCKPEKVKYNISNFSSSFDKLGSD